MASAAGSMASNLSLANFAQATDLRKRLWFTMGALIVFRLLSHVPLPGVDPRKLAAAFATTQGTVLDLFNNFSGGALERMSIIALGVMPYITASIVVQLSTSLSPKLAAIKKEGEAGRKRLNQYTRYGTVAIAIGQGLLLARQLTVNGVAVEPGTLFTVACVTSLIGGTMFLMWLGEQITSRGIGNGVSLIIMAGIVSQLPRAIFNLAEKIRTESISIGIVAVPIVALALIAFICFMERAQRRVLIQYPKRQTARGTMQGDKSFLPLKINTAGVIPPIFASSLLLMPLSITTFAGSQFKVGDSAWGDFVLTVTSSLQHGSWPYITLYAAGIIFFSFFYTAVVFNPEETAENLKKYGGFIPGIRPGKNTEVYLDYVLTRITVIGAAYLALICLVPEFVTAELGIALALGGTSLLIVVNVTMDTVTQIQSHLLAHQYGDLIKRSKLKGRGR